MLWLGHLIVSEQSFANYYINTNIYCTYCTNGSVFVMTQRYKTIAFMRNHYDDEAFTSTKVRQSLTIEIALVVGLNLCACLMLWFWS
jgi:hypothetical protein